ncbi:MAG TPA: hypothetical protein DEA08_16935, partial [Planctomycetes bacterium]|nr:hypothetical protein [Planctomycetota bacterium]
VRATLALVHVYTLVSGEREKWDRCFEELGQPTQAEHPAERYAAQLGSLLSRSRAAIRAPDRAEVHEGLWGELEQLGPPPSPELELEQLIVAVRVARGSVFRDELSPTRKALERLTAFEQSRWVPHYERAYAAHRSLLAAQAGALKPALTNAKVLLELDPKAFLPRVIHVVAMARAGRLDGLNRASAALQNYAKQERPDLADTVEDLLSHWVPVGRKTAGGSYATFVGTVAPGGASRVRVGTLGRAMVQVPITDVQAKGQVVITCKGATSDVDLFLRFDRCPKREQHDYAATSYSEREQLVLSPSGKVPSRQGIWVLVAEATEAIPHPIDFVLQAHVVPAGKAVPKWETPWESLQVKDPQVRQELAELPKLRQTGALLQARQKLTELTQREPGLRPLLGNLHRRLGDWGAIIKMMSEVGQVGKEDEKQVTIPVWLGVLTARAWIRLGNPANALAATEAIAKGRPLMLEGRELHLEALVRVDRLDEARAQADELLAQDPTLDQVRLMRALAIAKRDATEGLKLLDQLAQGGAVAPAVRRRAIMTLIHSTAIGNADKGVRSLLEEKVNVPEDRYLLAELLWYAGQHKAARELADKLGNTLPASPMTLTRHRELQALFKSKGKDEGEKD